MLVMLLKQTLLVMFIMNAYSISAQEIQRLFTTPAQRAELDSRRLAASQPEPDPVLIDAVESVIDVIEAIAEAPEQVVDVIYALQGIVRSSNDSYTVWLNNAIIDEAELPENMELLFPDPRGRLRVHNRLTGQAYDLMPGQVLNFTSGLILESYQLTQLLESRAADTEPGAEGIEDSTLMEEAPPEMQQEPLQ